MLRRITSRPITPRSITLHRISTHRLTSRRNTPLQIASHRITSPHNTSPHITSHSKMSHRMTSHRTTLLKSHNVRSKQNNPTTKFVTSRCLSSTPNNCSDGVRPTPPTFRRHRTKPLFYFRLVLHHCHARAILESTCICACMHVYVYACVPARVCICVNVTRSHDSPTASRLDCWMCCEESVSTI